MIKQTLLAFALVVVCMSFAKAQYKKLDVRDKTQGNLYSRAWFKADDEDAGGFLVGMTPVSSGSVFPSNSALLWNAEGGNGIVFATTGVDNGGTGGYAEQMRLTAGGNFLIGKSSQTNNTLRLDVGGLMGSQGQSVINTNSGYLHAATMYKTHNNIAGGFFVGSAPANAGGSITNNAGVLWNADGNEIVFATTGNPGVAGNYAEQMRLTAEGNFLIGKTSQTNSTLRLDVGGLMGSQGQSVVNTGSGYLYAATIYKTHNNTAGGFLVGSAPANAGGSITNNAAVLWNADGSDIVFATTGTPGVAGGYAAQMSITSEGKVGIGTTSFGNGNFKLYVEGGVRTRQVKVDTDSWADFVFEPSYKLPSLNDIEAYIKANKHLPGVPSAKELKKEGMNLGDMHKIQMQKIEELTLYTIQLKKENEALKQKVNKYDALAKRLEKLEKMLEKK